MSAKHVIGSAPTSSTDDTTSGLPTTGSSRFAPSVGLGEASLMLGPATSMWTEAIAYRQPSVDQVLRAHHRWLQQAGGREAEAQLDALLGPEAARIVQAMMRIERKFQLRMRSGEGSAWRPPCAVGATACSEIEGALHEWRRCSLAVPVAESSASLETLLRPCFCLFEFVLAGSWLHRRQPGEVGELLSSVEEAGADAPAGSYLSAVGPQLQARVRLQQSRFALLMQDFKGAMDLSRSALVMLQDRKGPRDFWPPHCWELAACHHVVAISLAGTGALQKVQPVLSELKQLLAPAAVLGAQPRLSAPMSEDLRVLKTECALALYMHPKIEKWDAPAEWRQLSHDVHTLLSEPIQPHSRASMLVASAQLTLLQELPWFVAGSARAETLDAVMAHLEEARGEIQDEAAVQKVVPVHAACQAMRGDVAVAVSSAQNWAARTAAFFGESHPSCECARRLATQLESSAGDTPPKALQQAIRDALASPAVSWLEPLGRHTRL